MPKLSDKMDAADISAWQDAFAAAIEGGRQAEHAVKLADAYVSGLHARVEGSAILVLKEDECDFWQEIFQVAAVGGFVDPFDAADQAVLYRRDRVAPPSEPEPAGISDDDHNLGAQVLSLHGARKSREATPKHVEIEEPTDYRGADAD